MGEDNKEKFNCFIKLVYSFLYAMMFAVIFLIMGIFINIIITNLLKEKDIEKFCYGLVVQIILLIVILVIARVFFKVEALDIVKSIKIKKNLLDTITLALIVVVSSTMIATVFFILFWRISYGNFPLVKDINSLRIKSLNMMYINLINSLLMTPMVEEIFFRYVLINKLKEKNIKHINIIIFSGLSFGIMHSSSFVDIVSGTLFGMSLATIYIFSENIIFPIAFHGLWNYLTGSGVFFIRIMQKLNININRYPYGFFVIMAIAIIFFIALLVTMVISKFKRKVFIGKGVKNFLINIYLSSKK